MTVPRRPRSQHLQGRWGARGGQPLATEQYDLASWPVVGSYRAVSPDARDADVVA